MVHNPYEVEPRKKLSPKQKLKLFIERKGICWRCKGPIRINERWTDEHVEPLWLNGLNCWSNRDITHEWCAKEKSAEEATQRAKIRRGAERHFGAHRSKRPMPCGRNSPFKRKMNGEVVKR